MWITRGRAAEILGCSISTVDRLITIGELHPRQAADRYPSLDDGEVAQVAAARALAREHLTCRRIEREKAKPLPPDDGYLWLTASQAGRVLGITQRAIYKRIQRGTIPYTEHRGRYWFRRDLVELVRNARNEPPVLTPISELAERRLAATPSPDSSDRGGTEPGR